MSVFISMTSPEGALLLTDAAGYDETGTVQRIGRKVFTARQVPVAITTRGHADGGEAIARAIIDVANQLGAAGLIDNLQGLANEIADAFDQRFAGADAVQILVAAWLPGVGATHRAFATVPTPQNFDMPPWQVYEPPSVFAVGPVVDAADMRAAGVGPMVAGEALTDYVRRVGADILEVMRSRPAKAHGGEREIRAVGGWCDLTVIDAAGARTETLRTWPDEIGERIDPFRAAPVSNRHARRAMRAAG